MLLQGIKVKAFSLRHGVSENLLIAEEPGSIHGVEVRSHSKIVQCMLSESTIVHWGLLIAVSHAQALRYVGENEAS